SIAIGVVQRVVAKQGEPRAHSNAAVDDQLILLEDAFGLKFVENLAGRRSNGCPRGNRIGIDEVGEELMITARIQIRDRQIGGFRELALQRYPGLHGVRSAQIGRDLVNRLRRSAGRRKLRRRHSLRRIEKRRNLNKVLLLDDAVLKVLLQHEVCAKTVVENSIT